MALVEPSLPALQSSFWGIKLPHPDFYNHTCLTAPNRAGRSISVLQIPQDDAFTRVEVSGATNFHAVEPLLERITQLLEGS